VAQGECTSSALGGKRTIRYWIFAGECTLRNDFGFANESKCTD